MPGRVGGQAAWIGSKRTVNPSALACLTMRRIARSGSSCGLRLSNWQGLHTLGPIAVIARNAQTLLGGGEAIARYLYVHSPALKLTPAPRTPQTGLVFTYEVTEPGLSDVVQTYEISMAIAVRIIR